MIAVVTAGVVRLLLTLLAAEVTLRNKVD